ncbi:MAG: CBS domain-containing protein [Acidimicrobiales bacterium]
MSEHASKIDALSPVAAVTAFDMETASPSADLETLARHMSRNDVGALVIEDHNGEVAILTERDIVHAIAFDVDAWAVDVMTRDVIEVASTTTIADAAETMRTAGVRHLLVRRADGALGITSIRDLLGPLVDTVA